MNIFDRALEVLDERGWHQQDYSSPGILNSSSPCAAMALSVASYTGESNYFERLAQYRDAVKVMLSLIAEDGFTSIPGWNDSPERSEEDVRLNFKRGSEILESGVSVA
jgi:hypothetical protein